MSSFNSAKIILGSLLIPLLATALQWSLWPQLSPKTWIFLYPATFLCAWLFGFLGGVVATLACVTLGIYCFIAPEFSWHINELRNIYSIVVFLLMGTAFSILLGRLKSTTTELLHLKSLELEKNQRSLAQALEAATAGIWEWNPLTNSNKWSDNLWHLYGLQPNSCPSNYATWLSTVHTDDRDRAEKAIRMAVELRQELDLEWRLAQKIDGQERWLMSRGKPDHDAAAGTPIYRGVVIDISERKLIEKKLLENEQRLNFVIDHLKVGVWEIDLNNKNGHRSLLHAQIFGYNDLESEWNFQRFIHHVIPEDSASVVSRLQAAWANMQEWNFDCRIKRADGLIRWITVSGTFKFTDQGKPPTLVGIVKDITDTKQKELEADAANQRYRALFDEATPDGLFVHDHKGNFVEVNQVACASVGYSKETLLTMNVLDLEQDFDLVRAQKEWSSITQGENKILFGHHKHKDGHTFPVEIHFGLWTYTDQRLYVALVRNISDRIASEQQIRKLSKAVEQNPTGIVITDLSGKTEYVNQAFLDNCGYSPEEIIGQNISLLKSGKTSAETYTALWTSITKGKVWQGEFINRRKDGSEYTDLAIMSPIRDEQGNITHFVATQTNITEQKLMQHELEQYRSHLEALIASRTLELETAKSAAEVSNIAKSAFLSNMSHEIRTPMNAVLGLCYLLEQHNMDEDSHTLVTKINRAGRALLSIVNDILDFSKIEAGRLEIETMPFHLLEILDQLSDLMSASALDKNLELIIIPPLDADALIGDGPRLKQVLINLLGNAIKFTEQGEVELRISIESQVGDQLMLRFEINDTGIGISAEHQQDLFKPFNQADSSISRRFGGTGLGLAISRQLVELLGGKLAINSNIGQGSQFWFVLPLKRDPLIEFAPATVKNLRLLIVDDNKNTREAIVLTSQSLGWQAEALDSGQAALLQIMDQSENILYDVLLIDWKMPGLDGLATAQLIRKLMPENYSESGWKPIILMVTAYSLKELQLQSLTNEADGLLSKPVTPSSLYNAVSRVLLQRTKDHLIQLKPSLELKSQRIPGVRVLVVDDSEINREVAQRILQEDGADVSLAEDGQEAIDWLNEHDGQVDVVLMDVQMPRMNGYEATRQIRLNPLFASLPIIALTAGAFKSLHDEALAAGMNDFISKPFDVEQLMHLIQQWASRRTTENNPPFSIDQQTNAISEMQSPLAARVSHESALLVIDIAAVKTNWKNLDRYQSLLANFINIHRGIVHKLSEAIRQGDKADVQAMVHKMKGEAFNLALNAFANGCIDIEKAIENGASLEKGCENLQIALDEVAKALIDGFGEN